MTAPCLLQTSRTIRPLGIVLTLAILMLAHGSQATAAEESAEDLLFDRFSVKVSGKFASLDTTVKADNQDNPLPGTEVDLESDLGLGDTELLGNLQFSLLLGRRHRVTFLFDRTDRSGVRTIAEEIRFEDAVFPINAELESNFKSQHLGVGYTFFFMRKERTALGATLALVVGKYETGLRGVGELENVFVDISVDASTSFPQPQLGLEFRQMVGEKWRLIAAASGLALKLDDGSGAEFDGSLLNASASLEHLTFRNASFGLGLAANLLDASLVDGEEMQEINSSIVGGEVFVRFRVP